MKPFSIYLDVEERRSLVRNISNIIDAGSFVLGEHTDNLESLISVSMDDLPCKTVSSGTVALECVFEYLQNQATSKYVAVQSNTNFATVSSIIRSGLKPVYIDCDRDGQLLLTDLMNKQESYDFGCIAIVHIGGFCSHELDNILGFCKTNSILVVEDCAHSHGSRYKGKALGTFGFASILSFFPTKLINGGEGGAVVSSNKNLIEFAHKWRNQGKGGVYGNEHTVLGGSYRMPEINCAIASTYYGALDRELGIRRNLYNALRETIHADVHFAVSEHMDNISLYKVICDVPNKTGNSAENKLKNDGIFCGGAVYRTPCHQQPVFKTYRLGADTLKTTNLFCDKHFCPPLHSGLSEDDIHQISVSINKLCNCP